MQNLSNVRVKKSNTNTTVGAMRTKMDAACLEQRANNVLSDETHGSGGGGVVGNLVARTKGSVVVGSSSSETGQQQYRVLGDDGADDDDDDDDDVWRVNNNNNNFMKMTKLDDEKQQQKHLATMENNEPNPWNNPCQSCEGVVVGGSTSSSSSGNTKMVHNQTTLAQPPPSLLPQKQQSNQDNIEQKSVMMKPDTTKTMTQHEAKIEDEGGGLSLSRCTLTNGTNGLLFPGNFQIQNNRFSKLNLSDINTSNKFECEGATAMVNPLSPSYLNADTDLVGRSFHSNRTSRNNSTENLSYSSDNYFPEELIFLDEHEDDHDVEADDASLNSDDCVYAYRGDGAEIDLLLNRCDRRDGGAFDGPVDDETDFLEMDFEPDPSSEADLANFGVTCDDIERFSDVQNRETAANLETFYKQRNSGHLSGRHSASISSSGVPNLSARRNACYPTDDLQLQQHRHFSSPTENLSLASQTSTLQAQSLLSKNFGRISLHLDQIRSSPEPIAPIKDDLSYDRLLVHSSSVGNTAIERNEYKADNSTAHSLPNSLHPNFGHKTKIKADDESSQRRASPTKATGAKPKRLSTAFSTSSSNSSKNSSKSRASLRSVVAPSAFFASASFDERSVSCAEFRSEHQASDDNIMSVAPIIGCNPNPATENTEESCLDCLEREFLANTIGNSNNYPKCRKHMNSSSSDLKRYARFQQTRCRSGSPTFFNEIPIDYFSLGANNHLDGRNQSELQLQTSLVVGTSASASFKRDYELKSRTESDLGITTSPLPINFTHLSDLSIADHNFMKTNENLLRHHHVEATSPSCSSSHDNHQSERTTGGFLYSQQQKCDKNQRSTTKTATIITTSTTSAVCDNIYTEKFSSSVLTSKMVFVTLGTINLQQEKLVQALDKLNISYNLDLIKAYYASNNNNNNKNNNNNNNNIKCNDSQIHRNDVVASTSSASNSSSGGSSSSSNNNSTLKTFKTLKDFLLYESKRNCDYPRVQRLIETATQNKVHVKFEEDYDVKKPELVSVSIANILQQFKLNNDLKPLKLLDKRFADMNVLGKIANIVRQAQTPHNSQRRASNDFLLIPQYYPSGILKITKIS